MLHALERRQCTRTSFKNEDDTTGDNVLDRLESLAVGSVNGPRLLELVLRRIFRLYVLQYICTTTSHTMHVQYTRCS